MRRVVVTGVGALSPVGNDASSSWQSLLAGRSGIGPVTRFDNAQFPFAIAGEIKGFDADSLLPPRVGRHMDVNVQYACVTALEALRDAGVSIERPLGETAGVIFGSGVGGYNLLEEQTRVFNKKGPRRVSPFFLANILPDAASGYLAMITGATGPNMAVVSACATGAAAIGEAYETIRRGDADLMICGGTEAPITPVLYSAFAALRAIATYDDDPSVACKPFDARRDGFVIAEGAATLILEEAEHAERRGARVYAEVGGYGSANDAFDMQASEENGRGAVLAIQMALRKAAIDPNSIGYVNAHGTGTPMNDRVETVALKRVFAKHAYRLAVSSTKSMTGHMMGAAGAFEAVACSLALHEQVLPPTMHYCDPDPDCDLDYVPNAARRVSGLEAVLSTSIGLGGHNAALIFKRAE
jgi:beta-ketoacyl-acyl-carrier-protein synthase II